MTVNVETVFEEPPSRGIAHFPTVYGKLRVSVDGTAVTRYEVDEGDSEVLTVYDHEGNAVSVNPNEYVGEFLTVNVSDLVSEVLRFQRGEYDPFEELHVRMTDSGGGREVVVLSHLDGDLARIAFRSLDDRDEHGARPYPPIEASVGYAVDPAELCTALARCNEELLAYLERGIEETGDGKPDLDPVRSEIEAQIDDLRSTAGR